LSLVNLAYHTVNGIRYLGDMIVARPDNRHGYTESVKLLISAGADVNLQNNGGNTALIYSDSYDFKEIVETLLSVGTDRNF